MEFKVTGRESEPISSYCGNLNQVLDDRPVFRPAPSDCGYLNQTLDDDYQLSSLSRSDDSSNSSYQSPFEDESLDGQSDSDLFVDAEEAQDDDDENEASHYLPVYQLSQRQWDFRHRWPQWRRFGDQSDHLSSPRRMSPCVANWRYPSGFRGQCRWLGKTDSLSDMNTNFSLHQSELAKDKPATGAGLWNLGNTCFLNVILQCLTHTVPLVQGLRAYNHTRPCERDGEEFCVFCALHNHIELAISSRGKRLSPSYIVDNLSYISSDFQRNQQEDAHELLQCLLDRLGRSCNNVITNDNDENLVNKIFGGRLVSKLRCCNCGHCSNTYEPLLNLSLEIENVSSVSSALVSFTAVEKIDDEEPRFLCESCKREVSVEKQLIVDHAPSIAAFHLKRFKHDGSFVQKIDKHVDFPLELDLMPYTSGTEEYSLELKYDLYAIVVHAGFSSTSGHYYCFIRSAPDAWYRLDDFQVSEVSEDEVLSRDAYILFYAKKGTPWFSTLLETEKASSYCSISNTSPKSVLDNLDQISESSTNMDTNITTSGVNDEDRRGAMTNSKLCSEDCRHEGGANNAKDDSIIEKKLSPSVLVDDNSFASKASQQSVLDVETNCSCTVKEVVGGDARAISSLSSKDCRHGGGTDEAQDYSKIDKKLSSSALRGEVKRSADVNSSIPARSNSSDIYAQGPSAKTFSIPRDHRTGEDELPDRRYLDDYRAVKEACNLLKCGRCSRRSQVLIAAVKNREICLNSKRGKLSPKNVNLP